MTMTVNVIDPVTLQSCVKVVLSYANGVRGSPVIREANSMPPDPRNRDAIAVIQRRCCPFR